ncbi:MAG TPA: V-type ATPase 116kDa subunit family protein [Methanoregula sp.]|nr:V-type ATPase 116kDa subunit family protein [Methanoregula sp.]
MKRIQVVGPKKEFNHVVDLLYHEGTIHLEDICQCISQDEIHLYKAEKEKSVEVAEMLSKISSILASLPKIPSDAAAQAAIDNELQDKTRDEIIQRSKKVIKELEIVTKDLAAKKSDLKFSITTLDRYAKILNIIQPMERELPVLENYEVTILLIQKQFENILGLIRQEMDTITGNRFEMSSTSVDDETLATLMIFHKRFSQQVHSFIYSVNVNEVRLPQEYMGKPFYEMFAQIETDKLQKGQEIKFIDEKLSGLSTTWYQELVILKKTFEDISEELEQVNKFGYSEFTFVVMGWIPKKFLKRMKETITTAYGDRVVIEELDASSEDMEKAPTFYDNPKWIKPFEFVMQLVTPPRYREIDPSPVLAIFFPIFFGLMVGDIGYGLVILAFALILKNKFRAIEFIKNLADILIISSVPTIIFGILFGEFFGDFGEIMGWIHPVHFLGVTWNRLEAIIPMLIFAIAMGVIHIFLGLIIGIINEVTRKNKKHISEKVGMLLALSGLIVIIALGLEMIPAWTLYPTIIMVIAALVLIIYGAGAMGPLEIMSSVGNILSYARLMAIGLASVILAFVANKLGGEMEVLAVGVFVAVLLHALNIILAMFSPSIHSVRLHLVEFFSKFYKGGGIAYKPFKKEIKG